MSLFQKNLENQEVIFRIIAERAIRDLDFRRRVEDLALRGSHEAQSILKIRRLMLN